MTPDCDTASTRLFRSGFIAQLVAALAFSFTLCAPFYSALAQSRPSNASISGGIARLLEELSSLSSSSCAKSRCETPLPSLPFTVRIPGYSGGAQVLLERAKVLNNIQRPAASVEHVNTRPILLRGKARLRHVTAANTTSTWVPITAVLHRRGASPSIEFALPYRRPIGRTTDGIALVRTATGSNPHGNIFNASISRTPSVFTRNKTCQAARLANQATISKSLTNTNTSTILRSQASYKVVYLATDFDPLFSSSLGCANEVECHDKILAIVHHAAVFYEAQLGMTIEVARQFGATTTYTSSTDSATLLDDFSQKNAINRSSTFHNGTNTGADLIDVYALFTGRNINENVVGLAYLGLGCVNSDPSGAALLVQQLSRAFDPVVTAHELGHVFSAEHSSQGIMMASLSEPVPTSFSSFSVRQISTHRSEFYRECRQGTSAGIGNSLDQPLTLRVSKGAGGKITIITSTTELQDGCSISIRAGQTDSGASTGTLIKRFTPASVSTSLTGTVKSRIRSSNSSGSRVFVRAFYSCSDGYLYGRSPVVSFNANTRAARGGSAVTRTSWIRAFDKAFP
jgi:hypothetical protein